MEEREVAIGGSCKAVALPANNKAAMRVAVAAIISKPMEELKLGYPKAGDERRQELQQAREMLMEERD